MKFDESQQAAINSALQNKDTILTGGAGTGKTTIIKAIAEKLQYPILLAPTGKAAARLKEATGFDASTIHRALMWDAVKFNRTKPFNCPVIVDESSMIDGWLMAALISFKPRPLILVGDEAQLPPVGKGQPFHDLIKLKPERVSTLTTCYRANGAVHIAATNIRKGQAPATNSESGGEKWHMKGTGGPATTIKTLGKWISAGQFDPKLDMILAPMHGKGEVDDGGIKAMNNVAKAILNPSDEKFAVNDRVLINKNFGTADLWNGDLGTITAIDHAGLLFIVLDRDEKERQLTKPQMKEVTHAYCLSVHKAQGSQARRVFFVCFNRHVRMLNRSLIYTAITRAKKGVCVMGELKAFYAGINKVDAKSTVLQQLGEKNEVI